MRDLRAHGGITYAGPLEPTPAGESWWALGFDAGHFDDVCPAYGPTIRNLLGQMGGRYRTMTYMRAECERLARQLAELVAN